MSCSKDVEQESPALMACKYPSLTNAMQNQESDSKVDDKKKVVSTGRVVLKRAIVKSKPKQDKVINK